MSDASGSGCSSWPPDSEGGNLTLWPGFALAFLQRAREFRAAGFVLAANDQRS